jgi:hypothetical protein
VRPEDRRQFGERFILNMIEWDLNADPYFYEHRHTPPIPIEQSLQAGGGEWWIFYNTDKFSGKKLVVRPGGTYTSLDQGTYTILVLRGEGQYGGWRVAGGQPGMDELVITHHRATTPLTVENTGRDDLTVIKFFGPDVNSDVPMLPRWTP